MPSPKLFSCPFCGCRPKLHGPGWNVYGYYVICEAKRCKVNPCTDDFPTRKMAIAAWNKRDGDMDKAEGRRL